MLIFYNLKRILTLAVVGLTVVSCTGNNSNPDVTETEYYREKIISQRILLDDALKQLQFEKQQAQLLKEQVEMNEKKIKELENTPKTKVVYKTVTVKEEAPKPLPPPTAPAGNATAEYEKMKQQVEKWQYALNAKEQEYKKIKLEYDRLIGLLSENNIEILKNKMGQLEGLSLKATNNKVSQASFDSLLTMLKREQDNFKREQESAFSANEKAKRLERLVNVYQQEIRHWKQRFNESGLYLKDFDANFKVTIKADSSSKGVVKFEIGLIREAAKLRHTAIKVAVACKLPNGNLISVYSGIVELKRHQSNVEVPNVKPYTIETEGIHEIMVYLENKEAYHEDMRFKK